jgi:hypothetical protein
MNIKLLQTAVAAALCIASTSSFALVNNVVDGSFQNGLTGWTQTGSYRSAPVTLITYGSNAPFPGGSAFGEAIPVDTISNPSLDPDAAGTQAAYFVDDDAVNQALTQNIFLSAGNYQIGFDVYIPYNGSIQPYGATFSATIAGVQLANYNVGSLTPGSWNTVAGTATIGTSGIYQVAFLFNTLAPNGQTAKDVVVDRVYVTGGGAGGRVIPEPGTLALFGIAGAGMVLTRLRKKA